MARDLTTKAFLDELLGITSHLRKQMEALRQGVDDSPAAIRDRRRRVLVDNDFAFFAWHYFPHHVRGEKSRFQDHFTARFPQLLNHTQGCREWWVAPRGETKSTLLTKIGPVYIAIRGALQDAGVRAELNAGLPAKFLDYVLLLGAETSLPTKLLAVVKTELESNYRLLMDFPEAAGRGPVWKMGEIVTKANVKIEPFGAEQAIRGTFHGASRPKVLFGDDLITDKEAKSLTERDNRWNWVEKAIDYLGDPDGTVKFLAVGTILNQDDPISRAKKSLGHIVHHFKALERFPVNMDLWERCEEIMRNLDRVMIDEARRNNLILDNRELPSYQFYLANQTEMDMGAMVSWPSVRSLYTLMRQRVTQPSAFRTEMQGEARNEDERVFGNVQFWVQRLPNWLFYAACDPSMGKNEKSDPSALVVGGYDPLNKRLHVVEAEVKRRVESKLLADMISLQREFNPAVWGFENNNAYEFMRTTFIRNAMAQQVVLNLVGVTATVAPEVRIDSLEPHINDIPARILLHANQVHLLDELDTWPEKQPHHHYDGLTALHILWMIAVSRAGGIPQIATTTPSWRKGNNVAWDNY
ncbi:hypothetical protein [Thiothrix nivea]|uniref:Phage protein n=1 Tax=Thiothrix nivea (strain ATCC 35100 / DSM 5205 / JP2) TaxID=870187 RepID=A0A656HBK6_THINJ|nr:hypothetical protein [Thiothrix nivea]EIJ33354.1 hypothetical protein Thini_0717 [Thiothrix nivea DSM 5205]